MAAADLQSPRFTDENAAREAMELILWPDGPTCPRCQSRERISKINSKSVRPGLYHCGACRRQFTVTVGTIFERSKVPLTKWMLAIHLMASSKKGMAAHQAHRMLGVHYETAWFMEQRIREAMRVGSFAPIGGAGKAVESDETYIGRKRGVAKGRGGYAHKNTVLSMVERGGKVRSFHVEKTDIASIVPIVQKNIARESRLMTDEGLHYRKVGQEFAEHGAVHHTAGEYVRDDIHTNTIEGFFSIFKRGMKGIYQHCSEKHLHRYLAEFDFRYNNRVGFGVNDLERATRIVRGARGKRLLIQKTTKTA